MERRFKSLSRCFGRRVWPFKWHAVLDCATVHWDCRVVAGGSNGAEQNPTMPSSAGWQYLMVRIRAHRLNLAGIQLAPWAPDP